MEKHWEPYFQQNRIELMAACRLNPSTMYITLSNDEVYEADRFLLSQISNDAHFQQRQVNIDNRNAWRVNEIPDFQQDEFISYVNSSMGISVSPTVFDLWSFWHQHKDSWPILHLIAMNIYHIPSSSASSERQFSKSKRIAGCLRLAMSPQKLQDQVLVASNPELTQEIIHKKFNI